MIIFLKSEGDKVSTLKKTFFSSRAAFLLGSFPCKNLPLPGLDAHPNCKGGEGGGRGGDGWVIFDKNTQLGIKIIKENSDFIFKLQQDYKLELMC